MLRKKRIVLSLLLLLAMLYCLSFAAGAAVDQKCVLKGTVIAEGLAYPNERVCQGDILVNVSTLVGAGAAARATVDGVVQEVLVKPGDMVKPGDVLVSIMPLKK